ncbi:tRNA guanosine(34) transglycosylase Tgt [Cyanobacterium stanieri LEGE 03274]|uniref:Queuine tRNA-ribosyltransferase n=1 Tax=Cyanobacterium stanieri LEGE 03274 TaxID=1828756 RepID=A0ABR9V1S6_9CHRO|nr:tRNA guanosine(34) transglycosylase Tgt [Cyanobacterium stanieri LEGE 03274]
MNFSYTSVASCSHTKARAGIFHTPHGIVETPKFMPVGTVGTVKGITPAQLKDAHAQMILGNTYHLHIRPGEDIVSKAGGLHGFMNWEQPILTDSGGFQVFSLAQMRKISEEGVKFRSPKDGKIINMTPEHSIQIQNALGADVIMAFDECPPATATREEVITATDRTYRWLKRCMDAHQKPHSQALFGIVQGGIFQDLRNQAAHDLTQLDLPGYAIGGVSVGEKPELIHEIVRQTTPLLPAHKPRYLMGVGTYKEMVIAIASGIDLFDCVIPTRVGRHGAALVQGERWNIKNARFKEDFTPLDGECSCYTCQNFSRAYLNHLLRAHEMLGYILISLHNIHEMINFTNKIRNSIINDTFLDDFGHWL